MSENERVLAADIGGTNLRLALVERSGRPRVVASRRTPVGEHPGLSAAVQEFLAELPERPRRACFGVAGTITGRTIAGVNLPWAIDADEVEATCGLDAVRLINDFHAAARGVEQLGGEGWFPLRPDAPEVEEGGPVAVLGAGTGLGQALLVPGPGGGRVVVSSEGGHRDFAPTDELQGRLLSWLRARHGRVSTERVLSGPGLAAIYAFLVEAEGRPACAAVESLDEAARPPAILDAAGTDPTCADAVGLLTDVYGAEAGNLALTVLARGGVFLAGGMAPELLREQARAERFERAFRAKGRFAELLAGYAVRVVDDPDLGLLGAAAEA